MGRPIVTFLSDFGAGSGYPAQMKGAVLSRLPEATLVDLSHDVPPFDLVAGALLLEACVPRFPVAAVHVAVVDPGVGTARQPVCVVDGEGRRLVGPDNGLFTPFLGAGAVFLLADPEIVPRDPSPTFHGRDLFAPVAAWLAGGGDPTRLGPRVTNPVQLPGLSAVPGPERVEGVCLSADPFGNLMTSIRRAVLGEAVIEGVQVAGRRVRLVTTFGEGRPGELLALWGSGGRLEIAVREGSALRDGGIARGDPVVALLGGPPAPSVT
ncbi:MAG: SAM-dependent chlorinase/fluorinase [Deltaproteobacteria bacterium]